MTEDGTRFPWPREVIKALFKPLDHRFIGNDGKGHSAVPWWIIADRLNRIFGPWGWHKQVIDTKLLSEELIDSRKGKRWEVCYMTRAELKVEFDGVIRRQVEIGSFTATMPRKAAAHELASMSSSQIAFKRAAVALGPGLGLVLYRDKMVRFDHSQPHLYMLACAEIDNAVVKEQPTIEMGDTPEFEGVLGDDETMILDAEFTSNLAQPEKAPTSAMQPRTPSASPDLLNALVHLKRIAKLCGYDSLDLEDIKTWIMMKAQAGSIHEVDSGPVVAINAKLEAMPPSDIGRAQAGIKAIRQSLRDAKIVPVGGVPTKVGAELDEVRVRIMCLIAAEKEMASFADATDDGSPIKEAIAALRAGIDRTNKVVGKFGVGQRDVARANTIINETIAHVSGRDPIAKQIVLSNLAGDPIPF